MCYDINQVVHSQQEGERVAMGIREKIAARQERQAEAENDEELQRFDRALFRMAVVIISGYAVSTVIALLIYNLK